jgi:uncharacterized RmlC-like cupin family protein
MSRNPNAQLDVIAFTNKQGECLGPVGLAVLHGLRLPVKETKGAVRVDRIRVPANFCGRAHRHPCGGINIVLQGSARHYYGWDLKHRDVHAGDIFYVPPGEPHLVCSKEGCVAVEVGLGIEGTEFCPELDELWRTTRAAAWRKARCCQKKRAS